MCGSGFDGGGDDGTDPMRSVFPAGGVRQADGTVAYCGDFQLVDWPPLRFENNTWGNRPRGTHYEPIPESEYEQCILAREGDDGIEFGWRWDWPLDRGHVKGYPEVHYGQKLWFWSHGSSAPDVPIRIADIDEMTVRYDVDMTQRTRATLPLI